MTKKQTAEELLKSLRGDIFNGQNIQITNGYFEYNISGEYVKVKDVSKIIRLARDDEREKAQERINKIVINQAEYFIEMKKPRTKASD